MTVSGFNSFPRIEMRFRKWVFLGLVTGILASSGCFIFENPGNHRDLDEIRQSGKLVVLTRNAPTTYTINAQGNPQGPEYDLVAAFAESLAVKPEFIIKDSVSQILEALKNGEGDLAAAGITRTEVRDTQFLFGPTYQEVSQQVVCRRGGMRPESLEELVQQKVDLVVGAGTSYEENLEKLKTRYPDLTWKTTTDADTEQLLEDVWEDKIDCTIADSNIVKINRRYFPELTVKFNIKEAEPLAWVLPKDAEDLGEEIESWLEAFKDMGGLDKIHARYYHYLPKFDYVNIATFKRHIRNRFPKFRKIFETASRKYGIPHNLLAAQAYQESRWNPRAKSPTGVRGIMMLTLNTARALGVKSRLEPKSNILAGARYLYDLKKQFDENIPEPDRTYMALAAYNVGRGHMHDAQLLARELNKNPHSWVDLREVLPLLSQKKYYRKLKFGYARGREPVRYVQRIRDYANILARELQVNGRQP